MPKSTICGCFFFKASHAQELVEVKTAQLILVEVVKILQLTGQQFQSFTPISFFRLKLKLSR